MPANPERASRGGDLPGKTKNDGDHGLGEATEVASASYDAGYTDGIQDKSLPDATRADLKRGYSSYGRSVGQSK